jgi:hypothetical protein
LNFSGSNAISSMSSPCFSPSFNSGFFPPASPYSSM